MSSTHQAASRDARLHRPRAGRLVGFLICGFLLALPVLLRPQGTWNGGHAPPHPGAVATLRAVAAHAVQGVARSLRPVQDWAHAQSRLTLFACAALMVCCLAYLMLRE